jgi:hypothetical protein
LLHANPRAAWKSLHPGYMSLDRRTTFYRESFSSKSRPEFMVSSGRRIFITISFYQINTKDPEWSARSPHRLS